MADDAAFAAIIADEDNFGKDTIVFDAPSTQTYHLAVHGFQAAEFSLEVAESPQPPSGLQTHCSSLLDGGTLQVGGPTVFETAVANQCVSFFFSGTQGTSYTVTVTTSGGDPSLLTASSMDFGNVLSLEESTGGENYAFTAAASQNFYVAVFPTGGGPTTDFQISVSSP